MAINSNRNDYIRRLEELASSHEGLSHARNILGKYKKCKSTRQREELLSLIPSYLSYLDDCLSVTGSPSEKIGSLTQLLNNYYGAFQPYESLFSSQSKWRSTILEEFLYLLFLDKIKGINQTNERKLQSGSVKAYSSAYFRASNLNTFINSIEININHKDQDFAVYRVVRLDAEGSVREVNVPIFAIEVKTYLDKTMFEGIVATAEKIKNGNPYAKFFVVTETYDVSFDVNPAMSKIDQIYVLRKCRREKGKKNGYSIPPIQPDVIASLVSDVEKFFDSEWDDLPKRLKTTGKLI